MSEKRVTLEVSGSEALVLFEFLSRFDDDEKLDIADRAEERVLWNLHGQLEKQLVEPFKGDYDRLLEQARSKVRDDNGVETG